MREKYRKNAEKTVKELVGKSGKETVFSSLVDNFPSKSLDIKGNTKIREVIHNLEGGL
ncbi:hypothetical protein KAR91_81515 [Candidatus Pacearchaeota archaeon]|nr:hypothetical protein [Candidatus Pacearchaeota archaeon]